MGHSHGCFQNGPFPLARALIWWQKHHFVICLLHTGLMELGLWLLKRRNVLKKSKRDSEFCWKIRLRILGKDLGFKGLLGGWDWGDSKKSLIFPNYKSTQMPWIVRNKWVENSKAVRHESTRTSWLWALNFILFPPKEQSIPYVSWLVIKIIIKS